jgi:hypothetical protein
LESRTVVDARKWMVERSAAPGGTLVKMRRLRRRSVLGWKEPF